MHKWVISIKVLRAVWKVNTIVYSQLYLRQNYNKLPAYYGQYSSSCFKRLFEEGGKKKKKQEKKKKNIQELISDVKTMPSVCLSSEKSELKTEWKEVLNEVPSSPPYPPTTADKNVSQLNICKWSKKKSTDMECLFVLFWLKIS